MKARTRKVKERQVGEVTVTDFNLNVIRREVQLGWRTFFLKPAEEEGMVGIRAQNRTLCTADSFFDLGWIRDVVPELDSNSLV